MPINKTLLRRIRNHILQVPEAYNQETWGKKSRLAPCGTACCIAGHAAILSGRLTPKQVQDSRGVFDIAAEVIGVNWGEGAVLFSGDPTGKDIMQDPWPQPFADRWRKAKTREARARVAADYLNYIIKTGKVT